MIDLNDNTNKSLLKCNNSTMLKEMIFESYFDFNHLSHLLNIFEISEKENDLYKLKLYIKYYKKHYEELKEYAKKELMIK